VKNFFALRAISGTGCSPCHPERLRQSWINFHNRSDYAGEARPSRRCRRLRDAA
jgi:hypothetical protein